MTVNNELAEAELVLCGVCPNYGDVVSDNGLGEGILYSSCLPSLEGILESLRVYQISEEGLYSSKSSDLKYDVGVAYEVSLRAQASTIRAMRGRGIRGPSECAKIIETVLERSYAYSSERGGLMPSLVGVEVRDYLTGRRVRLVIEEEVRVLENKMRHVGDGNILYNDLLKELYEKLKVSKLLGVVGHEL